MHGAKAGLIALGSLLVTACGHFQHHDALVFATDTKVALDVSANATAAGTPQFTLGYSRREGVYMPLLANGADSILASAARNCAEGDAGAACRTQVEAAGRILGEAARNTLNACLAANPDNTSVCVSSYIDSLKYTSVRSGDEDAYSVFASIGADFRGNEGGRAALAQFFATGAAAVEIAQNPAIHRALSVESPSTRELEQAEDRADAAEQREAEALARAQGRTETRSENVDTIMQCHAQADKRAAMLQHIPSTTQYGELRRLIGLADPSAADVQELREALNDTPYARHTALSAANTACPAAADGDTDNG